MRAATREPSLGENFLAVAKFVSPDSCLPRMHGGGAPFGIAKPAQALCMPVGTRVLHMCAAYAKLATRSRRSCCVSGAGVANQGQ